MEIKKYTKTAYNFIVRLSDLRFAGQVLFVVIVLLISWSGIKTVQTNYELQKQISTIKQQNSIKKLENTNLTLQNEYLRSNQYLELSARQNFGLAAPGDKEVIVPKSVALAYTIDTDKAANEASQTKQPFYQHNYQSWVDFFLHRQSEN